MDNIINTFDLNICYVILYANSYVLSICNRYKKIWYIVYKILNLEIWIDKMLGFFSYSG